MMMMMMTTLTELNTLSHSIKRFEIDGESIFLSHSTKTGVLMRGNGTEIGKRREESGTLQTE